MGKNYYSGGGTLLTREMHFATFDPAEEQKVPLLRANPTYGPVQPSHEYAHQVQVQLLILLKHIATGKKGLHVPILFRDEVAQFRTLIDWANSKPEFLELVKSSEATYQSRAPKKIKKFSTKRKPSKRKALAMEPQVEAVQQKVPAVGCIKPRTEKSQRPRANDPTLLRGSATSDIGTAAKRLRVSEAELQRRIKAVQRRNGG